MVASSATLAFRSAGLRARALPLAQRSLICYSRAAVQLQSSLRCYSSEPKPETAEKAKEAVKETAETAKEATKEIKDAPKEAPAPVAPKKGGRLSKKFFRTSLALALLVGLIYGSDTRASMHRYAVPPLIRLLYPDAEEAHHFTVETLKQLHRFGLNPRERGNPDGDGALATEVFGYTLSNPIGISGGLDKHADIPDALFDIGPAIVEVGGTTPLPQEGNPRPRVFRLPSQHAIINRYGLNSKGADHMAEVLQARLRDFAYAQGFGEHELAQERVLNGEANVPPGSLVPGKLLAVQVAKNKATPDSDIEAIKRDYVYCVDRLAKYADILVVNVSSPNTPGLRDLQATAPLTAILSAVVGAAKGVERKTKPFVMVKVSPDEDADEQVSGICDAVWGSGVDGVIVGNTTNRRPAPLPKGSTLPEDEQPIIKETGGYSGPQLADRTVALVARYRALLDKPNMPELEKRMQEQTATAKEAEPDRENVPAVGAAEPVDKYGRKTIFASGGITNGAQARAALDAGASVAMMYTGVTYGGIGTVTRVKQELRQQK
ncbi:hypothetical protein SI65_08057 [Aspergillus cristatus]|uniref:Dihydroorotate dehydrogenase (quinone), mitochondrial n=1 Tax=Aspergillus cristatus TaxID=573508 RepID=A0A1E3B6G1_ASPCR|nr:hypothetical protein SI65_08057 [Aspergillus cristatus]